MKYLAVFLLLPTLVVGVAEGRQTPEGPSTHNDASTVLHITFHATSVHYENEDDPSYCDPAVCTAKKYTVEGYADGKRAGTRTEYLLTCHEIVAFKPTVHATFTCGSIHADNDYAARLLGNSISFWPLEKYTPPPIRASYSILSEREISKPNQ